MQLVISAVELIQSFRKADLNCGGDNNNGIKQKIPFLIKVIGD